MKRYLWIVVALIAAVEPALAARTVYLKEGGTLTAKSVWRSKGQVHVLVNRDTLTKFPTSEIDLKRTFPHRQRITVRPAPESSSPPATAAAVRTEEQKTGTGSSRMTLPEMPKIRARNPEELVPAQSGEGTIRQRKKDMAERIGD